MHALPIKRHIINVKRNHQSKRNENQRRQLGGGECVEEAAAKLALWRFVRATSSAVVNAIKRYAAVMARRTALRRQQPRILTCQTTPTMLATRTKTYPNHAGKSSVSGNPRKRDKIKTTKNQKDRVSILSSIALVLMRPTIVIEPKLFSLIPTGNNRSQFL
jgi:hypothetical protein